MTQQNKMTKILDKNSFIKDRFIQVSEYYGLSIRKFEEKCQIGRGNISNIGANGTIGADKLSKIIDNCSDINLEWLLTGKGNMLKGEIKNVVNNNCKENCNEIQALKTRIEDMERLLVEKERTIQILMGTTRESRNVG